MHLASLAVLSPPPGLGFRNQSPHSSRRQASTRHPCLSRPSANTACLEKTALADCQIDDYNKQMAQRMGWTGLDSPYEYRPERGLYFHYITEDVIVGSQPRCTADVEHLARECNVGAILNLQQDKDLRHWGVDINEISRAAAERNVRLIRTPAVDFDPGSLRYTLPTAVAALENARRAHGRVYVHCTAGLGRSPAVAIACLYWFTDMTLDDAYAFLTDIRPCGPNKESIRGATYDLVTSGHWDGLGRLPADAFSNLSAAERDLIRGKLLGGSYWPASN